MRTYRFRLYPTRKQEKEMNTHLWVAKNLWNTLLETEREKYAKEGKFLSFTALCKLCKGSGMYAQSAQAVAHCLHRAIGAKIKAKRERRKWGFPRFKGIDRMKSLYYPQFGFSLGEHKLKVSPFGEISIVKHREIDGGIKTLTIKRMPSGKWFASLAVEREPKPLKENNVGAVGIDVGLMKFATLSDGGVIENPRHLARHEERLATLQRRLSKKAKRGKNRRRARVKVARLHKRVANTRLDFLHKAANELLSRYSLIALEGLAIQDMAEHPAGCEQGHGKGIHDAGWGMFANILGYKAEEAGCRVVFVNPKDTSKECNGCGQLVEKTLWDRAHDCPNCGLSIDRDLNAARNILIRADGSPRSLQGVLRTTAGTAGSNACGDGIAIPSGKQEAHTL